MSRDNSGPLFDVVMSANSPINAIAISGVTPIVSAWQKVLGVETVSFALSVGGTGNGIWTEQVSDDDSAVKSVVDPSGFANMPTFPTGVASSGTVLVPTFGYKFMRMTFTPSAGAGNVSMTYSGRIQSRPISVFQTNYGSVQIFVAAADTLAGTWNLEVSNDWSKVKFAEASKFRNNGAIADGHWPDALPSPVIAPLVASTGTSRLVRLGVSTDGATGVIEYGALRIAFTPSAGFGSPLVTFVGKGD